MGLRVLAGRGRGVRGKAEGSAADVGSLRRCGSRSEGDRKNAWQEFDRSVTISKALGDGTFRGVEGAY